MVLHMRTAEWGCMSLDKHGGRPDSRDCGKSTSETTVETTEKNTYPRFVSAVNPLGSVPVNALKRTSSRLKYKIYTGGDAMQVQGTTQ